MLLARVRRAHFQVSMIFWFLYMARCSLSMSTWFLFKKFKGLLILQDGPVQPGEHWHSNPWLDSTQLPPFKHGSDRQALSAMEIQRKRCYNVPTHNQSKTETEQHFLKECTKYTDILAQNKTHGPHICQTMRKSPSIPAALYASACFVSF